MREDIYCSNCIRECKIGNSFCHRRDANGFLKDKNRYNAVSFDFLFDKPIKHFRENGKLLSLGSWGCNFRCLGCQNAKLSWAETGYDLGFRELSPDEAVDLSVANNCTGICYTYNEPAILPESIEEIACRAKEKGLYNVLVTNSTLTEKSAKRISGFIDTVAADIKSLSDEFYYEYCGATGIPDVTARILSCIRTFHDAGTHVEVRTNIIPGANDQKENFHGIASWIRDNLGEKTPWHLTRFFPSHKLSQLSSTSLETLVEAQTAGIKEGLMFTYIYPDKGCDCAKETSLVKPEPEKTSAHCCCEK